MIITKAPLRISIAGGGTDLPSYYTKYGSNFISAAINKHVYIALNRSFTGKTILKYSRTEEVGDVNHILHPIFREVLKLYPKLPPLEIASFADIPSGTGLGSSGSFTVALLEAIHTFIDKPLGATQLAELAFKVEHTILGHPVGKQDQYIAAFGGLTHFNIDLKGKVKVKTIENTAIQNSLVLFFTGYSRNANELLSKQNIDLLNQNLSVIDNLHETQHLTGKAAAALFNNDADALATVFNQQWELKNKRLPNSTHAGILAFYNLALANYALGGKLIGAGGGGFLLFVTKHKQRLKKALNPYLIEVPFKINQYGAHAVLDEGDTL